MLLVFFLMGIAYAGFIDAGKNQGLAGGAIVLGWGVVFGGVAFIIAVFTGFRIRPKLLVKLNWILLILLLVGYGIAHFKYSDRIKDGNNPQEVPPPGKPTAPADETLAILTNERIKAVPLASQETGNSMGLGFFIPDFYGKSVLYFMVM
jgi:hypothetical protein